jgi:5'-3' exonuclease
LEQNSQSDTLQHTRLELSIRISRHPSEDPGRDILRDEAGVVAKFGVKPQSIPDYVAVVGDSADGFSGLPGWGVKAAALTLSQYPHLEGIPKDWREWHPSIRKAPLLSESLFNAWNDALLFRTLAALRLDVPVFDTVEALRWKGPRSNFEELCQRTCGTDSGMLRKNSLFTRIVTKIVDLLWTGLSRLTFIPSSLLRVTATYCLTGASSQNALASSLSSVGGD